MPKVHRCGDPPRRLLNMVKVRMAQHEFNELNLVEWLRSSCQRDCQYDITVFNGDKGKLNRDVEIRAWFGSFQDAQTFRTHWA